MRVVAKLISSWGFGHLVRISKGSIAPDDRGGSPEASTLKLSSSRPWKAFGQAALCTIAAIAGLQALFA